MKKIIMLAAMAGLTLTLVACDEDDTEISQSEGAENEEQNEVEGETEQEETDEEAGDDNGEDEFGTRNNPVSHGEVVDIETNDWLVGDIHYEMELIESLSGDEAWETVQAGNEFNDEAGDGKEYILAKFRMQLLEAEEEPFDVNPQQFDVISESGSSYEDMISVAGLDPQFRSDLYEGGDTEGWVPFLVDEDDEKPLAKYGDVWFDLRGE